MRIGFDILNGNGITCITLYIYANLPHFKNFNLWLLCVQLLNKAKKNQHIDDILK